MVSDATAKVGDTVSDLAAKTEKVVQEKIDQGKPVLRDLPGRRSTRPPAWLVMHRAPEFRR